MEASSSSSVGGAEDKEESDSAIVGNYVGTRIVRRVDNSTVEDEVDDEMGIARRREDGAMEWD